MATPLKFPPEMPLKVKQVIGEPPKDETDQINPPLRIVFQALGDVTHEAEPPAAPVLDKQRPHVATMLVENEKLRFVDKKMAGTNDAVENVKVAAARNGSASV